MRRSLACAPSRDGTSAKTLTITGQIVLQVVKMKFSITGSSEASSSRSRTGRASASTSATSGIVYERTERW